MTPSDAELLAWCDLPAAVPPESILWLRRAVTLLEGTKATAYREGLAAVALTAALAWANPSADTVYMDDAVWVQRERVIITLTQLGGALLDRVFNSHSSIRVLDQAIQEHWIREREHDTWQQGMRPGSGWKAAVKPLPVGLSLAEKLAGDVGTVELLRAGDDQDAPAPIASTVPPATAVGAVTGREPIESPATAHEPISTGEVIGALKELTTAIREVPQQSQQRRDKMSKEARALAVLVDHPDWTDTQIAEVAGCSRQSLYRMQRFKAARHTMRDARDDFPVGRKDDEGNMEV